MEFQVLDGEPMASRFGWSLPVMVDEFLDPAFDLGNISSCTMSRSRPAIIRRASTPHRG
jgi:hypothetical protein